MSEMQLQTKAAAQANRGKMHVEHLCKTELSLSLGARMFEVDIIYIHIILAKNLFLKYMSKSLNEVSHLYNL